MTKYELKQKTKSCSLSEACYKIGISRQHIYSLYSDDKEYMIDGLVNEEEIDLGIRRYNRIINRIELEKKRKSILNVRLNNISRERSTLSVVVKYKDGKEYLHTMNISTFISDGISLKKVVK